MMNCGICDLIINLAPWAALIAPAVLIVLHGEDI